LGKLIFNSQLLLFVGKYLLLLFLVERPPNLMLIGWFSINICKKPHAAMIP